nr:hypothetical protein [Tanacetum cinerariifolium]
MATTLDQQVALDEALVPSAQSMGIRHAKPYTLRGRPSTKLEQRLPIPSFICKVLNYFKVHISRFNPFDMVKLTTFVMMSKAYGGEPTVDLLRSFLNLGLAGDWLSLSNRGSANVLKALLKPITHLGNWKDIFFFIENKIISYDYPELLLGENKSDKKSLKDKFPLLLEVDPLYDQLTMSFMLEGVDGEFDFLPAKGVSEGQNSPSAKSVNNDALVIGATPLSSVYPSNIVKNVADSDDPSYGKDEQTLVGLSLPPHTNASKKLKNLGKRKVAFEFPSAKELRDATDCHWVVAHVTPLSWKQHLREISIEQLYDIHDRAYMWQSVLDNVDYTKLERKCNEALQDLDKNPLVSDMRAEIKVLQGQVDGLHSEYNMLILDEKKWEIYNLKQDRTDVVSKVISNVAMKLVRSDDLGVLIAKLVRSSVIYGRCQAFKEVAAMKDPFVLEKMSGYRPLSKEEYDQAGDALANASYPFLAEYVVNPYASVEQLLSKKPLTLRPILYGSRSKPLSSKVK